MPPRGDGRDPAERRSPPFSNQCHRGIDQFITEVALLFTLTHQSSPPLAVIAERAALGVEHLLRDHGVSSGTDPGGQRFLGSMTLCSA